MSGRDDYLIDPNVSLPSKMPNRQPLGAENCKPADIARSPIARERGRNRMVARGIQVTRRNNPMLFINRSGSYQPR
jgi:hypothetical protein